MNDTKKKDATARMSLLHEIGSMVDALRFAYDIIEEEDAGDALDSLKRKREKCAELGDEAAIAQLDRIIEVVKTEITDEDSAYAKTKERAYELFDFSDDEEIISIEVRGTDVHIFYYDNAEEVDGEYIAGMNDRPESLAYLELKRDDYND